MIFQWIDILELFAVLLTALAIPATVIARHRFYRRVDAQRSLLAFQNRVRVLKAQARANMPNHLSAKAIEMATAEWERVYDLAGRDAATVVRFPIDVRKVTRYIHAKRTALRRAGEKDLPEPLNVDALRPLL